MADNGGHSETERVLVSCEGLAIQSLLKIQSFPTGNFGGDKIYVNNVVLTTCKDLEGLEKRLQEMQGEGVEITLGKNLGQVSKSCLAKYVNYGGK